MNVPNNVSPIETLYATSGGEKQRDAGKEDGIDRRELFSNLVSGANLSQVAYAGLSQEFNLALSLRDNNFNGKQAEIETDSSNDTIFNVENDDHGSIHDLDSETVTIDDSRPADASVIEADAHEIDEHGLARTSEQADDAAPVVAQKTDRQATSQAPRDAAAASQKAEHIASNAVLRQSKENGSTELKAKVTDVPEELVSQPGVNLAASTAIAAQANQQSRIGGEATRLPAGDLAGDGEASLNGLVTRQNGKQGAGSHQHGNLFNKGAGQAKGDAQGVATGAAQTAEQAAAAAAQRNNLFAATLARAGAGAGQGQQSLQPLSGDLGLGSANNGQQQTQRAADLPQPQRARPQLPPRFVSDQVSVQVQRAVGQGTDRINIQLKPAELGRVEVKLEVAHDGKVNAVISAERQDTLDLLRQDARHLQQSLQSAGLNADSSSLSFTLQNQDGSFQEAMGKDGGSGANDADGTDGDDGEQTVVTRNIISDDKIDLEV